MFVYLLALVNRKYWLSPANHASQFATEQKFYWTERSVID